jgi:thymidine kinase
MNANSPAGRIEVIIGPIFSGTTTELTRCIYQAKYHGFQCIVISDSDEIDTAKLTVPVLVCSDVMSVFEECMRFDVIAVDEAQLFHEIDLFAQLLANSGKRVIVAGRDGTHERKPFNEFLNLIACCESLKKLSAICPVTGRDAFFTRHTNKSVIGNQATYMAASRSAYFGIETRGKIRLIIGPVHSGKTTELHRFLNCYRIARQKCIIVSPREEGKSIPVIVSSVLPAAVELAGYNVIAVDDGHHYKGIGDWADGLANEGKVVVIAAIDGNEEQEPFPAVLDLVPRCEEIAKLEAVCPKTGRPAHLWVLEGANAVPVSRQALLGGPTLAGIGTQFWRGAIAEIDS